MFINGTLPPTASASSSNLSLVPDTPASTVSAGVPSRLESDTPRSMKYAKKFVGPFPMSAAEIYAKWGWDNSLYPSGADSNMTWLPLTVKGKSYPADWIMEMTNAGRYGTIPNLLELENRGIPADYDLMKKILAWMRQQDHPYQRAYASFMKSVTPKQYLRPNQIHELLARARRARDRAGFQEDPIDKSVPKAAVIQEEYEPQFNTNELTQATAASQQSYEEEFRKRKRNNNQGRNYGSSSSSSQRHRGNNYLFSSYRR